MQPHTADETRVLEEWNNLSARDSLLVLNLLSKPPAPNAKLRKAIAALCKEPVEISQTESGAAI